MVLLDFVSCDPQGNALPNTDVWNAPFETPPRVGESVQFVSAGVVTTYTVSWVTHVYDQDGRPQDGYQTQIGIIET